MKRSCALLGLVFLFTLPFFAVSTARASAQPRAIGYRVDLSQPDSGLLRVTLEVEVVSQPLSLEIQDSYGPGLATRLASHIINESALDARGTKLPLRRDGNTWQIDGTGQITLQYDVDLSGYLAGTEYLNSLAISGNPWPYFPFLDSNLAYLPGYAIFIHPTSMADYEPRLELVLPPQWQQALPWAEQPANLEELLSNPIYAGRLAIQEQGPFIMALPSDSAAASGTGMQEYAQKAQALLQETESLLGALGPAEGEKLLLAFLLRGEGDRIADLFYPPQPFSSSIVLSGPSRNDLLSDSTLEATAREMACLWLATNINVEAEASWLREGTARYFQDAVPYHAGIWGARSFWDLFDRHYGIYLDARAQFPGSLAESGSLAPGDAHASAMLECGGASACAALDSELASMDPFTGDLATLMRNLAGLQDEGTPLDNTAIRSILENMTGRDWSAFFRDYVEGTVELSASSFSSLNVARPESISPPPVESTKTSTAGWIALGAAVIIVLLVPFILEPYAMRPRKPGFLEKKLQDDD